VRTDVEIAGRRRQMAVRRVNDEYRVTIDGREWSVDAAPVDGSTVSLLVRSLGSAGGAAEARTRSYEVWITPDVGSGRLDVAVGTRHVTVAPARQSRARPGAAAASPDSQRIVAPMPGRIVRVLAAKGDAVRARQTIVVIEAMKMENELRAEHDGVLSDVAVRDGQSVEASTLLAVIKVS
jgi:biotin carboxyl carrier protein